MHNRRVRAAAGQVSLRPIPPVLAGYVTRLLSSVDAPQGKGYWRLPDGQTELVVRFGDGPTRGTLVGTRSQAFSKPTTGQASFLLVRFAAASLSPFFVGPASRLTDELVPVDELWTREATCALAQAGDPQQVELAVVDALTSLLASASSREPSSARRVRAAVRALETAQNLPTVSQLASELGTSERHLRRAFDEVVGMSPKRYLRVLRFQRALALARSSASLEWAAIAQRAGYFDQAHLIADFRAHAGASPTQLDSLRRVRA